MDHKEQPLELSPSDVPSSAPSSAPPTRDTIFQLCSQAPGGRPCVVFDMDLTLLFLHSSSFIGAKASYGLSVVSPLDKILASPLCNEMMQHNIKFQSQLIAVILALKAKGCYVTLATRCDEQEYMKRVLAVFNAIPEFKGQAFDAVISQNIPRNKAVIRLIKEINAKYPDAKIGEVTLVDDELGNLAVVETSGRDPATSAQLAKTIPADTLKHNNQFLLRLNDSFKLSLPLTPSEFDPTTVRALFNEIAPAPAEVFEPVLSSQHGIDSAFPFPLSEPEISSTGLLSLDLSLLMQPCASLNKKTSSDKKLRASIPPLLPEAGSVDSAELPKKTRKFQLKLTDPEPVAGEADPSLVGDSEDNHNRSLFGKVK